jgi:hypothetical protein
LGDVIERRQLLLAGIGAAAALLFPRRQRYWVSRIFEITRDEHKVTVIYNDGSTEVSVEGYYA